MTTLIVPRDKVLYPTLGPGVCQFIEDYLTFGPGDLRGEPAKLDDEKRAIIYRLYEIFPKGHPTEGRRRFRRCAISVRKGWSKTELGAWIAICELHPDAPVRFDHWDKDGQPVGKGVTDPYIPLLAVTEEQSDELAYGAVKAILELSSLADDFDIGLERIIRKDGTGKIVSLSASPDARDGARTTFSFVDESHRWTLPRLKRAHNVLLANLPKRKKAEAWLLECTTAFAPGEDSVAERTMAYAQAVADGSIEDSRLFFFHRQAGTNGKELELNTPDQIRAAVIDASGPIAEWSDVDGIVEQWDDPTADKSYLERVWLNRLVRASERAFDVLAWDALARAGYEPPNGAAITLGFDGARFRDSVALVGTEIVTGYQWVAGLWEKPENVETWEAPAAEILETVALAFERWNVARMYCDPPYWESQVADWAGQYGGKVVFEWWTNRSKIMAYALRSFTSALASGEMSHSGDPRLRRHLGAAHKRYLLARDDEDKPLWNIYKERPDSPHKIDAAMAAVLSWEARNDALADGAGASRESAYEDKELLVIG